MMVFVNDKVIDASVKGVVFENRQELLAFYKMVHTMLCDGTPDDEVRVLAEYRKEHYTDEQAKIILHDIRTKFELNHIEIH